MKTIDCRAKASRLIVSPRFAPRNPIRSARVVSSVIKTMLGGAAPVAASEIAANPTTHNHCRIKPMPNPCLWSIWTGTPVEASAGNAERLPRRRFPGSLFLGALSQPLGFSRLPRGILLASQLMIDLGQRRVRLGRLGPEGSCLLQLRHGRRGVARFRQESP